MTEPQSESTAELVVELRVVQTQLKEIHDILAFFKQRFRETHAEPTQAEMPNMKGHKCPLCGGPMVARKAKATGEQFFGCAKFPECRGTRAADGSSRSTQPNKPPF